MRALIKDEKVGRVASGLLAFIGFPEDVELIVRDTPASRGPIFENRWLYDVVCALLEPKTEKEWIFLRKAALNEYDDQWVDAGAIRTLSLISTPRSRAILTEVRTKNANQTALIDADISYIDSNPPVLADQDLVAAGKKAALSLKLGKWQRDKTPRINGSGDMALINSEFIAGRDLLIYTNTFHKVGGIWKLRGTRETMQAYLGIEPQEIESTVKN